MIVEVPSCGLRVGVAVIRLKSNEAVPPSAGRKNIPNEVVPELDQRVDSWAGDAAIGVEIQPE